MQIIYGLNPGHTGFMSKDVAAQVWVATVFSYECKQHSAALIG